MTPAIMVIVYEIYWSFRVNGGCGEKQVLKQWCETSGYRCNTGTRLDTNGWPLNIVNGILSLKIKLTMGHHMKVFLNNFGRGAVPRHLGKHRFSETFHHHPFNIFPALFLFKNV